MRDIDLFANNVALTLVMIVALRLQVPVIVVGEGPNRVERRVGRVVESRIHAESEQGRVAAPVGEWRLVVLNVGVSDWDFDGNGGLGIRQC